MCMLTLKTREVCQVSVDNKFKNSSVNNQFYIFLINGIHKIHGYHTFTKVTINGKYSSLITFSQFLNQ